MRQFKMTEWHAVGAIDEAIERTRRMLFPIKWGLWLKLALIVLLAGWGLGGNGFNFNNGFGGGDNSDSNMENALPGPEIITLILIVVAVAIFVGLLFGYIGAVMKFGLIKALISGEAKVIDYFKEYADRGLSVFIFNLIAAIGFIAVLIVSGAIIFLLFGSMDSTMAIIIGVLIFLAILLPVVIVASIFFWLIDEIAIPIMYARNRGIVNAVKATFKLAAANPWQMMVFALLQLAFGLVGGMIALIISLPLFIALIAAIVILAIVAAAAIGITSLADLTLTPLVIAAIIVGIIAVILLSWAISYIIVLITLPLSVFLRFYGLIFLQRLEPTINLFPTTVKEPEPASAVAETIDLKVTHSEGQPLDNTSAPKTKVKKVKIKTKLKRKAKR